MVTVALVGADGAGKTTVARALSAERSAASAATDRRGGPTLRYLYMGTNPEASRVALPTTHLIAWLRRRRSGESNTAGGPPDPSRQARRPSSRARLALGLLRRAPGLVHRIADESYRQLVAWWWQVRGDVVVFDRHFFPDYFAHDIDRDPRAVGLDRRLHGWFLSRVYPRPDMVIVLDAPAEVLFARKGEGTPALLEARRQEYFALRDQVRHFAVVDADRPAELVRSDVLGHISRLVETSTAGGRS